MLRNERDEFEVGIDTGNQRHLGIGTDGSRCGTKCTRTTLSFPHILFAPIPGKHFAADLQFRDQPECRRLGQMPSGIRPKLGDQPFCTAPPIHDQSASIPIQKDKSKKIAFFRFKQPRPEERRSTPIPGHRVPLAIQDINGDWHLIDQVLQTWRNFQLVCFARIWNDTARDLKQVQPLRTRKLKCFGNAPQNRGRGTNRTPLLKPCVPGGAHTAELSNFLPPQARGSAPPSGS